MRGGPFVEITIVAGSPRAAHRCLSGAASCPARGEGCWVSRVRTGGGASRSPLLLIYTLFLYSITHPATSKASETAGKLTGERRRSVGG